MYPELSYAIVGILIDVHKRLGGSFEEKYYQRAVESLLVEQHIDGEIIGKYFLDFLIENKLVLEQKTVPMLLPIHFRQVRSYLKVKQLRLGLLANFRGERLYCKRVLSGER